VVAPSNVIPIRSKAHEPPGRGTASGVGVEAGQHGEHAAGIDSTDGAEDLAGRPRAGDPGGGAPPLHDAAALIADGLTVSLAFLGACAIDEQIWLNVDRRPGIQVYDLQNATDLDADVIRASLARLAASGRAESRGSGKVITWKAIRT
jgi:hypothetical protein